MESMGGKPQQPFVTEHWFAEPHKTRSIGAAFSSSLEPFLWRPGPPESDFDVLLFVAKTAAVHGNP
jgi:hypothetical protein